MTLWRITHFSKETDGSIRGEIKEDIMRETTEKVQNTVNGSACFEHCSPLVRSSWFTSSWHPSPLESDRAADCKIFRWFWNECEFSFSGTKLSRRPDLDSRPPPEVWNGGAYRRCGVDAVCVHGRSLPVEGQRQKCKCWLGHEVNGYTSRIQFDKRGLKFNLFSLFVC